MRTTYVIRTFSKIIIIMKPGETAFDAKVIIYILAENEKGLIHYCAVCRTLNILNQYSKQCIASFLQAEHTNKIKRFSMEEIHLHTLLVHIMQCWMLTEPASGRACQADAYLWMKMWHNIPLQMRFVDVRWMCNRFNDSKEPGCVHSLHSKFAGDVDWAQASATCLTESRVFFQLNWINKNLLPMHRY